MNEILFEVRGSHTISLPPERATVRATLALEGPEPGPVIDGAVAGLSQVRDWIGAHHDEQNGPVTWFSVDQLRRSSYRPWSKKDDKPVVHQATSTIEIKFNDFEALSELILWSVQVKGLDINYINWSLTEQERQKAQRSARQSAVRAALHQAQDYSDVLDAGPVSVRRVADPGVRADDLYPGMRMTSRADRLNDAGEGPDLTPKHIDIDATVEMTCAVTTG